MGKVAAALARRDGETQAQLLFHLQQVKAEKVAALHRVATPAEAEAQAAGEVEAGVVTAMITDVLFLAAGAEV